jgi:hypothetical protein
MLSFCAEPGNGAPASGCFRWYEQDSCDEVTQEALAWASIEETIWPQPEEGQGSGGHVLMFDSAEKPLGRIERIV